MAKFKVVTPAGVSYGAGGAGYDYEMEALRPIGAEIVEIAAKTDDEFVAAARDADALYAKGRPITKRIIDGLERCKVIALGSVGVDSVDIAAATARGIPVTNVPDTFIEEVADHAMMLILATLPAPGRAGPDGARGPVEGRAAACSCRSRGSWARRSGFIAFGHVARAVAVRARAFGVRMLAYDPYVEELVMSQYGVEPASLSRGAAALGHRLDARAVHARRASHAAGRSTSGR